MANEFNPYKFPILKFGSAQQRKAHATPTNRENARMRWWKNKYVGECFCCGRKPLLFGDAQLGRIKAGAYGGTYIPNNCRLICGKCNRGMSKTNMKSYMKRNYPERYAKYFPKEKAETSKPKRRRQQTNALGFNVRMPKFY